MKISLAIPTLILAIGSSGFAASTPKCTSMMKPAKTVESLQDVLDYGFSKTGRFIITEYPSINLIKDRDALEFVAAMRKAVESSVDFEVDTDIISKVGKMKLSATVVKSREGAILGGTILYVQKGAQNHDQRGRHIGRTFKNWSEAEKAGYTVRTGWQFTGSFNARLEKIGWWDEDNRMTFLGY